MTLPTEMHDYPEWHKGRTQYALWYLEIQNPELLKYLNQLRQKFHSYLVQPNTRQFHITLYICGFLIETENATVGDFDDNFYPQQFKQQIELLKNRSLNSFKLKIGKINSFSSALFVEVKDIENSLSKIRQVFSSHTQEIAALEYSPHITLGLYHSVFQASEILEEIATIPEHEFEVTFDQLTFGVYQAQVMQGPLEAKAHFQLNPISLLVQEKNSCCN